MPRAAHIDSQRSNVSRNPLNTRPSNSYATTARRLGLCGREHAIRTNASVNAPSPAPASNSRISSFEFSKSDAMNSATSRGVKNWPSSCLLSEAAGLGRVVAVTLLDAPAAEIEGLERNGRESTPWSLRRHPSETSKTALVGERLGREVPREETKEITPHLAFFQRIAAMIRKRLADDAGRMQIARHRCCREAGHRRRGGCGRSDRPLRGGGFGQGIAFPELGCHGHGASTWPCADAKADSQTHGHVEAP